MNRQQRQQLAQATLQILETGSYEYAGAEISIARPLQESIANSRLYRPNEAETLLTELEALPRPYPTIIQTTARTTLAAAQEHVINYDHVGVLNFASAKNPGGGFLNGSQAQEESLARSSGLYPTLIHNQAMYTYNRGLRDGRYSDHIIWSPRVPVFRNDQGELLPEAYRVSFITAPAVNAGVLKKGQRTNLREVMHRRARMIWSIAAQQQCDVLILGAWGCGVFRNEPQLVADIFQQIHQCYDGLFKLIDYAIYDPSRDKHILRIFEEIV